ncbi:hypothetical protein L1987_80731 [Smallanthus sonchifolius]|uniref:Uncharacterized protein n=1 Tax=Smallanthus sonchifolius TaxID=185202 RepID=A0ACB8YPL1_9ASTR|nr:hypothetical protein L1987_80731 [Smallanthus sonchifolius]
MYLTLRSISLRTFDVKLNNRGSREEEIVGRRTHFSVLKLSRLISNSFHLSRDSRYKDKDISVVADLFTRGIDIQAVNVVINFEFPRNSDIFAQGGSF